MPVTLFNSCWCTKTPYPENACVLPYVLIFLTCLCPRRVGAEVKASCGYVGYLVSLVSLHRSQVIPIAPRLVVHLLLRTVPTILICLGLYVVLFGEFLVKSDPELASTCVGQVCTWEVSQVFHEGASKFRHSHVLGFPRVNRRGASIRLFTRECPHIASFSRARFPP